MSMQANEGQEPQGGANGAAGQEPDNANGGQGQESGNQQVQEMDPTTINDPALRAYVVKVQTQAKEAREEAARYRTERNAATTKVTEFERANETAIQKAEREAAEQRDRLTALERENQDLKVGAKVTKAADDAKAFNPNLVTQMLKDKVTLDDQGEPENLPALIADLRKSDPYLFKRTQADGGAGNGSADNDGAPVTDNMNDRIRNMAKRGTTK